MQKLLDFPFQSVLPGHGTGHRFETREAARDALARCVAWMKARS
jgi:hypothetical protein